MSESDLSLSQPQRVHLGLPHCQITIAEARKKAWELSQAKRKNKNNNSSSSSSSSNSSSSSSSSVDNADNNMQVGITNVRIKKEPKPKKKRQIGNFGNTEWTSQKMLNNYTKNLMDKNQTKFLPGTRDFCIYRDIIHRCDSYKNLEFTEVGLEKQKSLKTSYIYFKTSGSEECTFLLYKDCIKTNPPVGNVEPPYKIAFRTAIKQIMNHFRSAFFRTPGKTLASANNGIILQKKNSEVVLKEKKFEEILDDFIREEKLDLQNIQEKISNTSPHPNKAIINSPDLRDKWVTYFSKHAIMEVVPKENVKPPTSKKRKTPPSSETTSSLSSSSADDASSSLSSTNLKEVTRYCDEFLKVPVSDQAFSVKNLSETSIDK